MRRIICILIAFIALGVICAHQHQGNGRNGFRNNFEKTSNQASDSAAAAAVEKQNKKPSIINIESMNDGFQSPKFSKTSIERKTRTAFAEQKIEVEDLLEGTKDEKIKQGYHSEDKLKFDIQNPNENKDFSINGESLTEIDGNSGFGDMKSIREQMMKDAEARRMQFGINGKQNKLKFNKNGDDSSFSLEDDFSDGFDSDSERREFLPKGENFYGSHPHSRKHKKPMLEKALNFIGGAFGFGENTEGKEGEGKDAAKKFGKSMEQMMEMFSKLAKTNPELGQRLVDEAIKIGTELATAGKSALNSMQTHWDNTLELLNNACASASAFSTNQEPEETEKDCISVQKVRSEWNAKKSELQFKCVDPHDMACLECLQSKAQKVKNGKNGLNH